MHVEHRRAPGTLVEGPGGDDRLIARRPPSAGKHRPGHHGPLRRQPHGMTGQFLYRNDNFLALLAAEPDRPTTCSNA